LASVEDKITDRAEELARDLTKYQTSNGGTYIVLINIPLSIRSIGIGIFEARVSIRDMDRLKQGLTNHSNPFEISGSLDNGDALCISDHLCVIP